MFRTEIFHSYIMMKTFRVSEYIIDFEQVNVFFSLEKIMQLCPCMDYLHTLSMLIEENEDFLFFPSTSYDKY